jgi:hypothetical protein
VEGYDKTNGAIDIPIGEMDGWMGRGVFTSSPIPVLDLRLEVTKTAIDSMRTGDLYVVYGSPYWLTVQAREGSATYTEVKGTNSRLTANIYDRAPKRDELGMEFDAGLAFGIFDLGLEFDYGSAEWTYRDEDNDEPVEGMFGALYAWKQNGTRFSATLDAALSDRISLGVALERLSTGFDTEFVDDGEDYLELKEPGSLEVIGTADVGLWKDWSVLLDVRTISYTDQIHLSRSTPDSLHYSDKTFVAPYLALVYSPRDNVEVRVGYGVNPTNYIDTPVEGRANGRERWLSQYLWEHSAHDWLDAEAALEDARTIGVMAVITF